MKPLGSIHLWRTSGGIFAFNLAIHRAPGIQIKSGGLCRLMIVNLGRVDLFPFQAAFENLVQCKSS